MNETITLPRDDAIALLELAFDSFVLDAQSIGDNLWGTEASEAERRVAESAGAFFHRFEPLFGEAIYALEWNRLPRQPIRSK